MKIYVSHSSNFDYQKELYTPLRQSELNKSHEIILPHEKSSDPSNSKESIQQYDLILAEVSYASTSQGIELGWASIQTVLIVCVYQKGSKLSNTLKTVSRNFIEYTDATDIVEKINGYLLTLDRQ